MIECSIGVMAYNEAGNVGHLLERLLQQRLSEVAIKRIVVVASGCTDDTASIAQRFADRDPRVSVTVQEERAGKASAINLFLPDAQGDVAVLISADTLPEFDAIERLVAPFADAKCGMTGGRPIPTNDPKTFWGHAAHLLWGLHHDIALQHPKLGEMVAFRNVVESIPNETAVDEASIEAQITERDLEVRYVPEAEVYNSGPDSLGDFLRQRRRIHAGHLWLRSTSDYRVSTMSSGVIVKALLKNARFSLRWLLFTPWVVMLEVWGRALGSYDHHIRKKNPFVWDMASSTKVLDLSRSGGSEVDA